MMNYQLITTSNSAYIDCFSGDGLLDSERAALDLVAACGEAGTNRLMLRAENLPETFYNLRTGLAGAILLKFSMYHLRVAAVLHQERTSQGRFYEFALETNRGQQFRIFYDRILAEQWLCEA